MACGTSFVKYVLFFFNLVVALFGLAVVGVGVAVLMNWTLITQELQRQGHLAVAPWVFIIVGAIMFVIAFFGCCGAIRESHCMVVTYAIFLLVIIIVQVVLAVLMFTYGETIQQHLVTTVDKIFDNSRNSPSDSERQAAQVVFVNIEQQLECCGKGGPSDYGRFTQVASLPSSCCVRSGTSTASIAGQCTLIDANKEGCRQKVAEIYQTWNKTIAAIAIGVACIEVVGALFALCLANSIRNMDRRYA
ncbi:CD63 antigen-like isoform X2 [Hyposmocoma kahamanoa]|uniref:CD63 antigen-like isoform X2 n=1 Tax=Hyposmocoma kahamanoa TaxID=1477025 RepID=UPI000E6D89AF|nr:CD63 antigen-like isoform X2 [Hyposmocoma kahamanoa]